uniref:Peptidase A1 domain-containing protein n=1 Tax=Timema monikensis TaxID=170555 RepID=A0A7R9E279_9NEOP|nr:unnamed protein product [Timema monikensis]
MPEPALREQQCPLYLVVPPSSLSPCYVCMHTTVKHHITGTVKRTVLYTDFCIFFNNWEMATEVNCGTINKLPEISFLIGGKNFTLKARNYIQQITWGGFELCLSAFIATDLAAPYDNLWALGAAFIGQYYTEFDLGKNRIGFAESYQ